jgi:hypothetical protein
MKKLKSFDEFVFEGALGTAAASLGMRGKGSSSYRNTSGGKGDKNEWKKYVNPKRWFSNDKLEDEEEYCDSCDRVISKCVCDNKEDKKTKDTKDE